MSFTVKVTIDLPVQTVEAIRIASSTTASVEAVGNLTSIRGWTLQELLAPKAVIFFDADWNVVGHKCWHDCACRFQDGILPDYSPDLNYVLWNLTGIHPVYLAGELSQASIACKMSWAAFRFTSEKEDEAYCLQGLFDINMPMIPGEGGLRAFMRLQQEIVRTSTDQSIFAWTAPPEASSWLRSHLQIRR